MASTKGAGEPDFRKQHDGLVAIVRDELESDPLDGSLFAFFNRRHDRIKLLSWDANGFWLFYKRLERGTFERLRDVGVARLQITRDELSMLLDGIDVGKSKKRRNFAEEVRLIAERDEKIATQAHTIDLLTRIAFGRSSEKRRAGLQPEAIGQGHLFHADLLVEAERTAEAKDVQGEIVLTPPKQTKKAGGRRKNYPGHLPRVSTNYELPEDKRWCSNCGGALHEIGDETSCELERLETAIVHEIRRRKYACRCCTDGVVTALGPDRVIGKASWVLGSWPTSRWNGSATTCRTVGCRRSTPPKSSTCRGASTNGPWRSARPS